MGETGGKVEKITGLGSLGLPEVGVKGVVPIGLNVGWPPLLAIVVGCCCVFEFMAENINWLEFGDVWPDVVAPSFVIFVVAVVPKTKDGQQTFASEPSYPQMDFLMKSSITSSFFCWFWIIKLTIAVQNRKFIQFPCAPVGSVQTCPSRKS